jgi:hypothetical protein
VHCCLRPEIVSTSWGSTNLARCSVVW